MSGPIISYNGEIVNLANVAGAYRDPNGNGIVFSVVGSEARVLQTTWPEKVVAKLCKKVGVVFYEDLLEEEKTGDKPWKTEVSFQSYQPVGSSSTSQMVRS